MTDESDIQLTKTIKFLLQKVSELEEKNKNQEERIIKLEKQLKEKSDVKEAIEKKEEKIVLNKHERERYENSIKATIDFFEDSVMRNYKYPEGYVKEFFNNAWGNERIMKYIAQHFSDRYKVEIIPSGPLQHIFRFYLK